MSATPALFERLLEDDSASAGGLRVPDALARHGRRQRSAHLGMVGSLVVAAQALDALAASTSGDATESVGVTLVVADPASAAPALAAADAVPALRVDALDVRLPAGLAPGEVPEALRFAVERRVPTYVSVPYDDRRDPLLRELPGTGLAAVVHAGGRDAEHPGAAHLAAALVSLADAAVPFRVTGIDRALARADARPGHDRTGVLNLLVATDAAWDGAGGEELEQVLTVCDTALLDAVLFLDPGVRSHLHGVAVTDLDEIVDDLVHHGLAPVDHRLAG